MQLASNWLIIWEYIHRLGYIAWIVAIITAYLGLQLLDKITLASAHLFGWGSLLLIIYIVLSIWKFIRNKQEKAVSFEQTAHESHSNINTTTTTR